MHNYAKLILVLFCIGFFNKIDAAEMPVSFINPSVVNERNQHSLMNIPAERCLRPKINEVIKDTQNNDNDSTFKGQVVKKDGVAYDPVFKVKKVIFSGNTAIGNKKLTKIAKSIVGKNVKIKDVINLSQKITDYYHQKGYITSRAYVPFQKVENGVVEIAIDENKISEVEINGNKWAKTKYLESILSQNGVSQDKPFNVYALKNSIDALENEGYIKGKATVSNSRVSKNMQEIQLNVKDRFPIDIGVELNNDGHELIGTNRSIIRLADNNLTGHGDKIYSGLILSSGARGGAAGYSLPVGTKGARVNLDFSSSNLTYGGELRELGLTGQSRCVSLSLTRPLYKKDNLEINSVIAFDVKDVNTTIADLGDLTDHHVRALRAGISARRIDSKGIWLSNIETSTGLPIMGATVNNEDGAESGKFVKFNVGLLRLQKISKNVIGLFRINAQYTPNKLLAVEKVMLGGAGNLRGYQMGTLMGDVGVNGSFEIRTPVPFLNKVLPEKFKPFGEKIKLGYFYDWGIVSDVNGYANAMSHKDVNFLQTAGIGIHVPISEYLMVNVDLGIPLFDNTFKQGSMRCCFSVSSTLQNLWNRKWRNTAL